MNENEYIKKGNKQTTTAISSLEPPFLLYSGTVNERSGGSLLARRNWRWISELCRIFSDWEANQSARKTLSTVLVYNKYIYYLNTDEIPGEFSRENMISSHVKITCYLHMWKYHRCYGYIINRAFHTKKLLKWNGLVFHWCLYNK